MDEAAQSSLRAAELTRDWDDFLTAFYHQVRRGTDIRAAFVAVRERFGHFDVMDAPLEVIEAALLDTMRVRCGDVSTITDSAERSMARLLELGTTKSGRKAAAKLIVSKVREAVRSSLLPKGPVGRVEWRRETPGCYVADNLPATFKDLRIVFTKNDDRITWLVKSDFNRHSNTEVIKASRRMTECQQWVQEVVDGGLWITRLCHPRSVSTLDNLVSARVKSITRRFFNNNE